MKIGVGQAFKFKTLKYLMFDQNPLNVKVAIIDSFQVSKLWLWK